jgi:hypothetical protein
MAGYEHIGYPALAEWTAHIPAYEGFIFRRFDQLSARNLQHLESELALLEAQLQEEDAKASRSVDPDMHKARRNWSEFEKRSKDKKNLEFKRMKLVRKVEGTLRRYSTPFPATVVVLHIP